MSQTDPEVQEEKEEQQRKSGRSAFFAGVHGGEGDTFGGSFRGVPAAPHGGAVSVRPEDTIGDSDCWCGLAYGHEWKDKSKGAPHPRGGDMSTATDEKPYLNPRDLKSWDRKVVRALCALVNDHGVSYRIDRDHMHIYLSVPGTTDEEVPRMKAGRSREPEHMLAMLERWAARYIRPIVTEEKVKALAAKVNDPTKKPHDKKPAPVRTPQEIKETPVPSETAEAPHIESSQASDGAPEGYHQHIGVSDGEPTNWWEADNHSGFLCKSCDYTVDGPSLQTRAAHQRVHSTTPEFRAEVARKSSANRDGDLEGRRTKARNAIRFLAEEYDINVTMRRSNQSDKSRELTRAEAKIGKLQAALDAALAESAELKAKQALLREAMGL